MPEPASVPGLRPSPPDSVAGGVLVSYSRARRRRLARAIRSALKPSAAGRGGQTSIAAAMLALTTGAALAQSPSVRLAEPRELGSVAVGYVAYYAKLTLSDIDGDGDLDVLLGNLRNSSALINSGTPQSPEFTASRPLADLGFPVLVQEYGDTAFSVLHDMVDLDADGDLDAVLLETFYTYAQIRSRFVFAGNNGTPSAPNIQGAGLFAPVPAGLGYQSVLSRASAADMDADGDPDLVIMTPDKFLEADYSVEPKFGIWENTGPASGSGQFQPMNPGGGVPAAALLGRVYGFSGFDLADLDADGDLDIVFVARPASGYGLRAFMVANTGNAAAPDFLAAPQRLRIGGLGDYASYYLPTVGTGDLDGDGDLDLVFLRDDGGSAYPYGAPSDDGYEYDYSTPYRYDYGLTVLFVENLTGE